MEGRITVWVVREMSMWRREAVEGRTEGEGREARGSVLRVWEEVDS